MANLYFEGYIGLQPLATRTVQWLPMKLVSPIKQQTAVYYIAKLYDVDFADKNKTY